MMYGVPLERRAELAIGMETTGLNPKKDVVSHPIVPMCDCPACGHRHWKKKAK